MRYLYSCLIATVLSNCLADCAFAQTATQESTQANETSDLTQGLLDLLNPPLPKKSTGDQRPQPELTPADVGLDRQELSEQPANPLESVRQSMLIAAGYLQRGAVNAQTQQLQSDIVTRLDELIAQFDNAASKQQHQQSREPSEQRSQNPPQQDPQQAQATQTTAQQPPANDVDASQQQLQSGPGQVGPKAEALVELADPQAMQQSVWGHLPERTRTQMQSRMVEQFLPSYRTQIEAYFKALLEQD
ncbi:MAG: hypothetical protein R3C53_14275 [Pirellulaceae bacterium]